MFLDSQLCRDYVLIMPIPIITIPDPILRAKAEAVERVDAAALKLADDMLEAMYAAPGVGLAAPQVAVLLRLIVMDVAKNDEPRNPICMFNPEIVKLGGETRLHEEGCLSIPDIYAEVERPGLARVRFVNRTGKVEEMACEGLLATVVQHEIDHLDGILFIDYLSRLKRDRLIKKFHKTRRENACLV
jgi:peptide deformylase